MSHRLSSLTFDREERPLRATIRTPLGAVKVLWQDVCGDWCWFTAGTLEAKKLAAPVIHRIEQMLERL